MNKRVFEAAENLRLYEETLGGSGSPYLNNDQNNYADDIRAVCDFISSLKNDIFCVVEVIENRVLGVYLKPDYVSACQLGVELASACLEAPNGDDILNCLANDARYDIDDYSVQITSYNYFKL
jgi:hypothetical protein